MSFLLNNPQSSQPGPNILLPRDRLIADLEKHLVAKPNAAKVARNLLGMLENYVPSLKGIGTYSDCQRKFVERYSDPKLFADVLESGNYPERYKQWKSLIEVSGLDPQFWILQLYAGNVHSINGTKPNCSKLIDFFLQEKVIPKICFNCHKVQIIPVDLVGLMKTYFILRAMKLPRDNARKCMVEMRENVPFPYKGYIYCDSEEEALFCRDVFLDTMKTFQLDGLSCRISHGCSEHGLEYLDFKYSEDGSYKDFQRPPEWDDIEEAFFATGMEENLSMNDYNKAGISARDAIGFNSWVDYAEIIGDETWKLFRDKPKGVRAFDARIRKQAETRNEQLRELRKDMAI